MSIALRRNVSARTLSAWLISTDSFRGVNLHQHRYHPVTVVVARIGTVGTTGIALLGVGPYTSTLRGERNPWVTLIEVCCCMNTEFASHGE